MYGEETGFVMDGKASLILIATNKSKSAFEVSRECNLPLSTTYRKLDELLRLNMVKVTGEISNGKRHLLFTNNSKKGQFKNSDRVLAIMSIISSNPGISFRDVLRQSGLTNGVLSHYLARLQEKGFLLARRTRRKVWLFTGDMQQEETSLIIQIRNETSRAILMHLLEKKEATFYDFTGSISKCPASISLRLSKLIEEGVVKKTGGVRKNYYLKDPKLVARIFTRVFPGSGISDHASQDP